MRRTALSVVTVVAGLLAALLVAVPAAPASEKHPVPYNFLPYAVLGGAEEDPPGANDWSCKPTRKRPRPVVLVHGTFGNRSTNWQTYAPLLHNNGYCVFALTYGVDKTGVPGSENFGGMTRMQDSARELKRFVAKVRKATGSRKVDLVGHSQGTLMPTWWLKYLGGAPYVNRYVSLAPLWHGTQVAEPSGIAAPVFGADDESTPVCVACGQFRSGSAFMKKIRAGGGPGVDGISYTNIMTEHDQLVVPYTSGREPGMRNVVVQDHCDTDYSDHFQIAADPVAAQVVLNALDPKNAKPVPCSVVLPYAGGPPA